MGGSKQGWLLSLGEMSDSSQPSTGDTCLCVAVEMEVGWQVNEMSHLNEALVKLTPGSSPILDLSENLKASLAPLLVYIAPYWPKGQYQQLSEGVPAHCFHTSRHTPSTCTSGGRLSISHASFLLLAVSAPQTAQSSVMNERSALTGRQFVPVCSILCHMINGVPVAAP